MKWYGVIGLIAIVLAEIGLFFNIDPINSWYYPIIWFGLIFFVDALVFSLSNRSLLTSGYKKVVWLFILSTVIWWTFEIIEKLLINSWTMQDSIFNMPYQLVLFKTIRYMPFVVALFELFDLVKVLHHFDKWKLDKKHEISKTLILVMLSIGIVSLLLTVFYPAKFFWAVWIAFFFLLDPINYINKTHSIIRHLKDRKLKTPLTLTFAALIFGLLNEYWNFWDVNGWTYHLTYLNFLKIFEMPILGYLGYVFFAFEAYAFYYFLKFYIKKIHLKLCQWDDGI